MDRVRSVDVRSDSPRRATLSGSRALRAARVRARGPMRQIGSSLASALLALGVVAGAATAQEPPVARHVLSNGMTVLVRENPAVVGGRGLAAGASGLTIRVTHDGGHHQLPPPRDAARHGRADGRAARARAPRTSAAVSTRAARSRPPRCAARRSDATGRRSSALSPRSPWSRPCRRTEIEKERRLILGQIKARADAPFSVTLDAMLRDLYGPQHPYGRQSLGIKESIERLTRDDLLVALPCDLSARADGDRGQRRGRASACRSGRPSGSSVGWRAPGRPPRRSAVPAPQESAGSSSDRRSRRRSSSATSARD